MLSGSAKFSAPSSLHVCFCKVPAGGFGYEKEEDIKKLFLKGKNNLPFQCDILIKRENCYNSASLTILTVYSRLLMSSHYRTALVDSSYLGIFSILTLENFRSSQNALVFKYLCQHINIFKY